MKRTNTVFAKTAVSAVLILAIAGTIFGAVWAANRLIRNTTQASPVCGPGYHDNHKVIIRNDVVTPSKTMAPICDTLTITNLDDRRRLVAFGPHEAHVPYDGITERLLDQGQSLTVTLVQVGSFRFHDHIQDEVQGTFVVTQAK